MRTHTHTHTRTHTHTHTPTELAVRADLPRRPPLPPSLSASGRFEHTRPFIPRQPDNSECDAMDLQGIAPHGLVGGCAADADYVGNLGVGEGGCEGVWGRKLDVVCVRYNFD